MHSTSRLSLNVPDGGDGENAFPAVSAQQMGVLDGSVMYLTGTISGRPAAGLAGRVYFASDTGQWFLDTGSVWEVMLVAGAWQALTLATSITSGGYGASARLVGDTVQLKGTLTNGTGSTDSGTLATIPSGLRPGVTIVFPVQTDLHGLTGCHITTSGLLTVAPGLANLDNIHLTNTGYTLS